MTYDELLEKVNDYFSDKHRPKKLCLVDFQNLVSGIEILIEDIEQAMQEHDE